MVSYGTWHLVSSLHAGVGVGLALLVMQFSGIRRQAGGAVHTPVRTSHGSVDLDEAIVAEHCACTVQPSAHCVTTRCDGVLASETSDADAQGIHDG